MSCSTELRIFQNILKRTRYMHRMSSSATTDHHKAPTNCYQERDPLPLFHKREVQILMKNLTGLDLAKVFPQRLVPKYYKPEFLLVTDEELKQLQERAFRRAKFHLHMPPAMKSESTEVPAYSEDKEIAPFLNYKFVFTDISKGLKDRERFVTVRDTDGTLRPSTPEEKRRCLQIYYPKIGRNVIMQKMFEKEHLENILHEDNYRYILDRACIQFEPDNPDYIRVCHRIYDHAAETKSFDALRSTRFFGPMAFYFAWNKNVELLLIDMIKRDLLTDAVNLLRLYQIIHPELTLYLELAEKKETEEQINILLEFSKEYANHKYSGQLELTILQYRDILETEQQEKST